MKREKKLYLSANQDSYLTWNNLLFFIIFTRRQRRRIFSTTNGQVVWTACRWKTERGKEKHPPQLSKPLQLHQTSTISKSRQSSHTRTLKKAKTKGQRLTVKVLHGFFRICGCITMWAFVPQCDFNVGFLFLGSETKMMNGHNMHYASGGNGGGSTKSFFESINRQGH